MSRTRVVTLSSNFDRAPSMAVEPDIASLHAKYADFVWRSLQRVGVRHPDLEDALQDVFMVVHQKIGAFEARSKLSTWLFAIVVRVAHSYRRKNSRQRELARAESFPEPEPPRTPEDQVHDDQARQRLERVLAALAPEQRALLVMFEIEELPCAEIAELLGVPVGTVHSRLHGARAAFLRAARRIARSAGDQP
jgi:RNA polymerase sigma-70 factor, ECF subfamily